MYEEENANCTENQLATPSRFTTKTLINLVANPESSFDIYEEVQAHYTAVLAQKAAAAAQKKATIAAWKTANPALVTKMDSFLSEYFPD